MRHKTLPMKRIGIVGLGLIGGSLLKALRVHDSDLMLLTVDQESDESLALVDEQVDSLELLANVVDCLILAVPISVVTLLTTRIAKATKDRKNPLLVLDVASVKRKIAANFEQLSSATVEFVATHPMAGSEKLGFSHSRAGLFINAPWVVAPHGRNTQDGLEKAKGVIECVGATPIFMEATAHDRVMAMVSHVPAILAKSYLEFVRKHCPEMEKIIGPGFRSFTRIAHSNPKMRQEIAQENKKEIQHTLFCWMQGIMFDK